MNQLIDIFSINEEIIQSFTNSPTPPQRNNYEELVIVSAGAPKFVLDFKTLKFPVPVMLYASPGRIHQFVPDADTRGWCIRYQSELLQHKSAFIMATWVIQIGQPVAFYGNTPCIVIRNAVGVYPVFLWNTRVK